MDPVEEMAFVVHSLPVLFTGRRRNNPSEFLKQPLRIQMLICKRFIALFTKW